MESSLLLKKKKKVQEQSGIIPVVAMSLRSIFATLLVFVLIATLGIVLILARKFLFTSSEPDIRDLLSVPSSLP